MLVPEIPENPPDGFDWSAHYAGDLESEFTGTVEEAGPQAPGPQPQIPMRRGSKDYLLVQLQRIRVGS